MWLQPSGFLILYFTYLLYKDRFLVNTPGGDGSTALHFAHTTKIANIFLDCNADLDTRVGRLFYSGPDID